jgi:predicted AlkP superfamily pyrophosphatase or phosphodiesterase
MRLATWIAGLTLALIPLGALAAPVLMISVDGLQPADVLEAQQRGIQLPVLSALVKSGAYATGVKNVLPTVTYPNHTTLITGVSPARHGIAANVMFDPLGKGRDGWYWYASDIKVATLWDVVHAKGQTVASIGWPVSVGAQSIDANIPEYWRAEDGNDVKLLRALSTPGLAAQLEDTVGAPLTLSEEPEGDEAKAQFAVAMIATKHPQFMTLHLSSLDHWQHTYGPNTPQAHDALQRIDTEIGAIVAAARKTSPDVVVAVVSDHGFAPLEHQVNLKRLFADAGLLTIEGGNRVTAWDAMPWGAGGATFVVLARPDDAALRAKVAAALAEMQKRPDLGIAKIIDQKEAGARGATPMAAFAIDFKLGYQMGGNGETVVTASKDKGMHGWFPDHPEMHSTFIIAGDKLAKKGSLGEIDMRDIAPTLAKIMDVSLPAAEGKPLF